MTVVFRLYDDVQVAHEVVRQLLTNGVPSNQISVLATSPLVSGQHNTEERQGSFADAEPVYHDRQEGRQGSFADAEPVYHDRQEGRQGSFADAEPVYHDRQEERQGSFADMNLDTSNADMLRERLIEAGMDQSDAVQCTARLQPGMAIVLVRGSEQDVDQAAKIIF